MKKKRKKHKIIEILWNYHWNLVWHASSYNFKHDNKVHEINVVHMLMFWVDAVTALVTKWVGNMSGFEYTTLQ